MRLRIGAAPGKPDSPSSSMSLTGRAVDHVVALCALGSGAELPIRGGHKPNSNSLGITPVSDMDHYFRGGETPITPSLSECRVLASEQFSRTDLVFSTRHRV